MIMKSVFHLPERCEYKTIKKKETKEYIILSLHTNETKHNTIHPWRYFSKTTKELSSLACFILET